MRLFVAAYPPDPARADLARVVGGLGVGRPREPGRSVRLVPEENWHLTLAFLGEVPESALPKVARLVDRSTRDRAAPTVRVAGGGTFGRGPAVTLWAGLAGDVAELTALATGVAQALRRSRLSEDRKPFRPHVTLARPGDRMSDEEVKADLAVLDGYRGPAWTVGTVRVMRSHLGPRPQYDVVHETLLTG